MSSLRAVRLHHLYPLGFVAAYILLTFASTPTPIHGLWRPMAIGLGAGALLVVVLSVVLRNADAAALATGVMVLIPGAPWLLLAVVGIAGAWMSLVWLLRRRTSSPSRPPSSSSWLESGREWIALGSRQRQVVIVNPATRASATIGTTMAETPAASQKLLLRQLGQRHDEAEVDENRDADGDQQRPRQKADGDSLQHETTSRHSPRPAVREEIPEACAEVAPTPDGFSWMTWRRSVGQWPWRR